MKKNKEFNELTIEDFDRASFGGQLASQYNTNRDILLIRVNDLLGQYSAATGVASFGLSCSYRSLGHERSKGRSGGSAHCVGQAIDIKDVNQHLCRWIMNNQDILSSCDLYMENPAYTSTWCHLGTRAPKSGNRIFIP